MNLHSLWDPINAYMARLPNLLIALIVLLIGWLVAKAVAKAIEKLLVKTKIDQKFFKETGEHNYSISKIISKIVYYLALVYVFVLFFNILQLSIMTTPLVGMISGVTAAVPNILKAALILVFAWIIASVVRVAVVKLGKTFRVGALLQKLNIASDAEKSTNLIENASKIVFYLILLIFLPGVLAALQITGISAPFTRMIDSMLLFIPKLFAAALVVLVGWVIAKIVRDIVTNLLISLGLEKLTQRFGLTRLFEGTTFSSMIGTVVYVLILIPTVIAALDQLNIEGISQPAIAMLNNILTMLPNIAVAIVLILVGLWLGRWVASFVNSLLTRLGFNSILSNMGIGQRDETQTIVSLSQIVGYIVQVTIVLLFTAEALQVVNLHFLVTLATGVIAYLPHLFAAIVILAVGLLVGNLVQKLLASVLQKNQFKMLDSIAKYAIIGVSLFMALDQLGVAPSIVNAAFILILGALALAFGLSFGLGGKDFASKYLSKFDAKIESVTARGDSGNMKQDMKENFKNVFKGVKKDGIKEDIKTDMKDHVENDADKVKKDVNNNPNHGTTHDLEDVIHDPTGDTKHDLKDIIEEDQDKNKNDNNKK